ncbi:glycosyltransferase family 4 protein [Sphingobacterium yanglingense]|uniref:Glycosyltransferase involved in cell wall biosynthesis n=1 Tax=Sphingobacterium yanglingense TaxID=1437280 RepID=A0A4R6W4J3_9SPHI|nr:glycosyltransferase family 4 protein [Sphingobacterium yanglingense]TDQ73504.1 glycosyltransferase involved in cell wall biosynthesis [Sphingobacterium yanglingense]
MKIVYFYQYFSTPKGSWGTRVYEFAKEWVKDGHEVTVVTSVYSKSDLKATNLIENQCFEGIHVKVLNVTIDNKQIFLKRIWSFFQYSILCSYYAVKLPADVVIASSGPITIGIPGLIARYIRGRRLVFETRDLWPEGAIELGIIKSPIVQRIAYWFEKVCYRASSYIVTLSPGMTENIKRRFRIENITDVTNAANIELFSTKKEFLTPILTPKSYAIYTGNIGMVNNSYWLYNAAKELQVLGREDIKIVLIGEGQQREELEALAIKENVTNFIRLGLMSKEELVAYVQNAFVSLVPLKGTPVLDTSSPNKFFESLAAGVPIIQNTQGWMKEFLWEHAVGYTLDPSDPKQLAQMLIQMKDNSVETEAMGVRALDVAKQHFDKYYLANKMLDVLMKVHHDRY